MIKYLFVTVASVAVFTATAVAEEPAKKANAEREPTKASFVIAGLHCPPCTKTVESSLGQVKGVRSIEVDWASKTAKVEFDEAVLPAQRVAQLIADTPHMMGSNMHYGGLLMLRVSEIKDVATAKQVQDALSKVEGVKRTAKYPQQHSIAVMFELKGNVTSQQLIDALAKAGFHAENRYSDDSEHALEK